jgi:hypothetical protein
MWHTVDTVMFYEPDSFEYSPSVAIFNFVGTLAANTNGRIAFKYANVKKKLTELHEKGASIIVIQQANDVPNTQATFEEFSEELDIPIAGFFPTKSNKYSKPYTWIWAFVKLFYKNHNKVIKDDACLMVGHLSGRIKITSFNTNQHPLKTQKPLDRAFAYNIGVSFASDRRFFLNPKTAERWKWSTNIPQQVDRKIFIEQSNALQQKNILGELSKLPTSPYYMIFVTGGSAHGKSTLAAQLKLKWAEDHKHASTLINIKMHTRKTKRIIEESLARKQSVIISSIYKPKKLLKLLKIAMIAKAPVLIVEVELDWKIARLLDQLLIQNAVSSHITTRRMPPARVDSIDMQFADVPSVYHMRVTPKITLRKELWYEYCPE